MEYLNNKEVKKLLVLLTCFFILGIIILQGFIYFNAENFKKELIEHDSKLAGYLINRYPELALELPSFFTSKKSETDLKVGKRLLSKTGYNNNVNLNLLPKVSLYY